MTKSTEAEVLGALRAVSPAPIKPADPALRLREDLGVDSLALVSVAVDLCDRFGMDPARLDLGAFIDRADSLGDLIGILDDLRRGQQA